jgi:deoxyribonuclease-4
MFGAHLSIAGGCTTRCSAPKALGCDTVQVFTKTSSSGSASRWRRASSTMDDASQAAEVQANRQPRQLPDQPGRDESDVLAQSVELFIEEMRRCDLLGIPYLVTHPGAHMGAGEEAGIAKVIAAMNVIHRALPNSKTITCLESPPGQGTCPRLQARALGRESSKAWMRRNVSACVWIPRTCLRPGMTSAARESTRGS